MAKDGNEGVEQKAGVREQFSEWLQKRRTQVVLNYLNKEDIKEAKEQKKYKADAIVILGGDEALVVDKAADLFHKGYAPKIVFVSEGGTSGGEDAFGMTEYEFYRKRLLALGVPESAIISPETLTGEQKQNIEDDLFPQGIKLPTTNTGLEAKVMSRVVAEVTGKRPKKLILVSRQFHSRRVHATFKKENEGVKLFSVTSDEEYDLNDIDQVTRIYEEIPKLHEYRAKGFLTWQAPDYVHGRMYRNWRNGVKNLIKQLEQGTEEQKGKAVYLQSWLKYIKKIRMDAIRHLEEHGN